MLYEIYLRDIRDTTRNKHAIRDILHICHYDTAVLKAKRSGALGPLFCNLRVQSPARACFFFLKWIYLFLGNVSYNEFPILCCNLHCSFSEFVECVYIDMLTSSCWRGIDISTNCLRAQHQISRLSALCEHASYDTRTSQASLYFICSDCYITDNSSTFRLAHCTPSMTQTVAPQRKKGRGGERNT